MAGRMKRKQVYIDDESDRKLKRIAAQSGRTESEVLRDALRRLPEPALSPRDKMREELRTAGLLAEDTVEYDPVSPEELEAAMQRIADWSREHPDISLSDVLMEEREENDRRLL